MSDNVQYQSHWEEPSTQCQNCKFYQEHEGKKGCVPEDMSFDEAIAAYGEVESDGHCDYFALRG